MADTNQQGNNNNQEFDVMTSVITFKNETSEVPSALRLNFWKNFLNLRISPRAENETEQASAYDPFNWKRGVGTALSIESVQFLMMTIQNHILPAIEQKKMTFKGRPVGIKLDALVGVGVHIINGEAAPYLAIFRNIEMESRKSTEYMKYYFKPSNYVLDYDPETGAGDIGSEHIELGAFKQILAAAIIGLSNAQTHSDRLVNRNLRDRLFQLTNGNQQGGGGGYQRSNSYNRTQSNQVFGNGNQERRNTNREPAPVENADSYDALEGLF